MEENKSLLGIIIITIVLLVLIIGISLIVFGNKSGTDESTDNSQFDTIQDVKNVVNEINNNTNETQNSLNEAGY